MEEDKWKVDEDVILTFGERINDSEIVLKLRGRVRVRVSVCV